MGFWQGAGQGAIIGGITGITGAVANAAFTGQNLTLKAVLQGAVIGGIIGGVVGGINEGNNATGAGNEYWSGEKWNELNTGYSPKVNSISGKYDFSGTDWDIDQNMSISQTYQGGEWDCTHACKLSVDKYYNNLSSQTSNNNYWLNRANNSNGVINKIIPEYYKMAGYSTNPLGNGYFQSYNAKVSLPWITNEMKSNRIVQIGWKPDGINGHASLITRVRYLSDFSKFRIDLMNPASGGLTVLKSFNLIHQIFSVWK